MKTVRKTKTRDSTPLVEGIATDRRRLWGLLNGLFLMSFSLLAFEITLTRMLSEVLSYHYVFVVVSLTLLGLGLGGVFVYFAKSRRPPDQDGRTWLSASVSLFARSVVVAAAAMAARKMLIAAWLAVPSGGDRLDRVGKPERAAGLWHPCSDPKVRPL